MLRRSSKSRAAASYVWIPLSLIVKNLKTAIKDGRPYVCCPVQDQFFPFPFCGSSPPSSDTKPMLTLTSTADEQRALCVRAQAGDRTAADDLIRSVYPLMVKIAAGFLEQSPGFEHDDLIQEGLLAALDAIRYFRVERGYLFTTYAADCARRRIWRYLHMPRARPLLQDIPYLAHQHLPAHTQAPWRPFQTIGRPTITK